MVYKDNDYDWTAFERRKKVGCLGTDCYISSINRKLPAFAKLAVCVFEEMSEKENLA
ncbi:MAG: hypothetical protein AAGG68_21520 [Bacteroidota bacterium]